MQRISSGRQCPGLLSAVAALVPVILFSIPAIGDDTSTLTVIRGYEGTQDYAVAASDADEEALADLYETHVTIPYQKKCSGEGDQFLMSQKFLETPIRDTEELGETAAAIEENEVDSLVRKWTGVAQQHLPIPSLTVCIFPYSPDEPFAVMVKENLSGTMGFVERGGLMWAQFIPADGWLETLPHVVLHEYHHAFRFLVRPQEETDELTLLQMLVVEGSAEAFALSVRPVGPYKPFATLTDEQQAEVWAEMREHLDSSDPAVLQRLFYGDGERVPRFSGYGIGRAMATNFVENNPEIPAKEWSAMPAEEFLRLSGYNPGQ